MAQTLRRVQERPDYHQPELVQEKEVVSKDLSSTRQAYQVLHFGYSVLPLVVGTDKFFHVLTNWDQYLSPLAARILGVYAHPFMLASGVMEIIVGIGMIFKPKIFAYLAFAWLLSIAVNLASTGIYYDIALRDFGLSLGALALGRLSLQFDRSRRRFETA
jgi:hypothetical protein